MSEKRFIIRFKIIAVLCIVFSVNYSRAQSEISYSIPSEPWEDSLGNHRAIIEVSNTADAVRLNFNWRRHDLNPEKRQLLIVNAKTGDTIHNIQRLIVNQEKCELIFGPVEKGTYHFYYLPFKPDHEWGYYRYGYLKQETTPDSNWVAKLKLDNPKKSAKLPLAKCIEIQARKEFDSFYPMEVIATQNEVNNLIANSKSNYVLIAEDRKNPIKMRDHIPFKWFKGGITHKFEGTAFRDEYYAFQLGVYASKGNLENVELIFEDLKNLDGVYISSNSLTCFNTTGIDPYGKPFQKRVNVAKGKVQTLWVGVDISEHIKFGKYTGNVVIKVNNQPDQIMKITLNIANEVIVNRGDDEPWRHSRLRWLNSTIGLDDKPMAPYTNIKIGEENNILNLYGKQIVLKETGLPKSVKAWETEILSSAINYELTGENVRNHSLKKTTDNGGSIVNTYTANSNNFDVETEGVAEFDGHLNYKVKIKAKSDITLENFKIDIPFKTAVAEYMMGMGLPGTVVPENHSANWKGPHDSFWVGNTYGGLHVEMRGGSYHGPLLNLYKPAAPESWNNEGKGGFFIKKGMEETLASIYTGERSFTKGEELVFEISFLVTPVKPVNTKNQFTNRYYHNGQEPKPKDEEITDGVKVINVHHANDYNPYINYPFIATKKMHDFVDEMHAKDLKVKIYYTIRELTNRVTEIWALRSLGNEILGTGKGGGYPWLQEHFVSDYNAQWYSPLKDGIDASVITAPGDSRWFNYYLEGLSWLVKNIDIDGLYLDDVSFDRRIIKRMRKVLHNAKSGCMLDLHSNTGFSKGPAMQYAEYFPYLDKLWFGESFIYDEMPPENWLVEVSGIPFGHMGDMLHAGGNPWRGMVYGMTVRYPWFTDGVTCDPRQIWKIWDSFGIADSKMIGYWDKNAVVSTLNNEVKATAYVKEGKLLISVASWAKESVNVKLNIDWKAVGLDKSKVKMYAPKIENFQPEKKFSIEEEIIIDPIKGWLLIIE